MDDKLKKIAHLDDHGAAQMVDISKKDSSVRLASASAELVMASSTLEYFSQQSLKKGDAFAVARIAGIQAAKRCSELIPLCHQLPLASINVEIQSDASLPGLRIFTHCKLVGKTGVEMEALTAASVAGLALYDMAKSLDREMMLQKVKLIHKSGGQSGEYNFEN